MNCLKRLQITIVITMLLYGSMAFGITVSRSQPDSLPKGATVNEYDGDHHFMQALEITMDGGGTWNDDDNITITIPTGISLADVDGDASYSDGISVSFYASSAMATYSVDNASAQFISINLGNAEDAIASGSIFTVVFPITTSLSAGDSLAYVVSTESNSAGTGETTKSETYYVQFSRKVTSLNDEYLDFLTFATNYDGTSGDSTDTQGQYYPRSAAAAILSVALPDFITDQTSAGKFGDVINGNDTGFESFTLNNNDASDEIKYYVWGSTRDSLKRIDGAEVDIIQTLAVISGTSYTLTDNEDGTFASVRLDATIYDEGTWYFYVTSSVTADWVLGKSGAVKVTHRPTLSTSGGYNEAAGIDYDNDLSIEPSSATPDGDNASTLYMDGSGAIGKNGNIGATGGHSQVDSIGIYYSCIDYDDIPTIQIFRALSTHTITRDSIYTSGTSPSLVVDSLAGTTELTSSALVANESYKIFYYNPVRSTTDYDTAGTYYLYVVANDGKFQSFQQLKNNAGTVLTLYIKYFPKFTFDDEYYTKVGYSSSIYTLNTQDEQYYVVNWGQLISGDNDIDGDMKIELYASDKGWAGAGGSAVAASVDTSLLPTDAVDDTAHTVHIASILDTSDTKTANRYMWDARNSGLAASTGTATVYKVYAVVTSNSSSSERDKAVVTLNEGESMLEGTQRKISLKHGSYFLPKNPVEGEVVSLGRGDSYEFRWEAFDMDASSSNCLVSAFMVPTGTSIAASVTWTVAKGYDVTKYYWLFPTSGAGLDSKIETKGEPGNNSKYVFKVADIYVDMGGNNSGTTSPESGTYDLYYFYATDGTFGLQETIKKADGQLFFSTDANNNTKYNFRLQPTQAVITKEDTLTFAVLAYHASTSPMGLNIYIDIPAANFTVIDQDTSSSGTNPFLEVSSPFNGTVTTNTLTTSSGVYQMNFETHTANFAGVSMTTVDTIATFQLIASDDASGTVLEENLITFSTTGSRVTRMIDAAFVEFGQNIPPTASRVRLNPRGTVSGFVDLQGIDTDSGEAVTFYLASRGSFDCITDAVFKSANGDADLSNGLQYTLGANGSFTLSKVPAGKYDLICGRDGWLTQREDSVTVQPYSTTTKTFNNANRLYAGDCGGYDDDGSTSTTTLPDNQINSTDYQVLEAFFDKTWKAQNDTGWHSYCDFNEDSVINIYDLQWPALNYTVGNGEGINYKTAASEKIEDEDALARLIVLNEENGETTYGVTIENFSLLHCYEIRMLIDTNQWQLVAADNMMESEQKIFFIKQKGCNFVFVGATLGQDVSPKNMQTLFWFTMKPLIEKAAKPKIQEATIINVHQQANSPVIFIGIDENTDNLIPKEYSLSQNYPNPFNPNTKIQFGLPEAGEVKLVVYNMLGQKVRTLVSSRMEAGYYKVAWNGLSNAGTMAASGMYFYRIDVDSKFVRTRKMLMLK